MEEKDQKIRVILADHEPYFSDILAEFVEEEPDLTVVGIESRWQELIEMIIHRQPDVVLMDVRLPDLDGGYRALQEIQQMPEDVRPRVMVVTSYVTPEVINEVYKYEVFKFVAKPFELPDLMNLIRQAAVATEMPRMEVVEAGPLPKRKRGRPPKKVPEAPLPDTSLEEEVTEILHDIGIPAHIKGYQYLRYAILLVAADMGRLNAVTKLIYPAVAQVYGSTASRVERAIRHAIEVAWDRGDVDVLQKYFGYTVSDARGKPTNSEFIAMIADRLIIKRKKVLNQKRA